MTMKSLTNILIELTRRGVSAEILLENVVYGSMNLSRLDETSAGEPADDAEKVQITSYFDAYGDLRFTNDGILVQEYSPMMRDLSQVANVASADSGLIELMDGFEGTVEELYSAVCSRYHLLK